ncbi:hypothetical protein M8542_19715 [Amycolatopsis sp. OK19-0408]|uniref:Uncharacterized protein n=1 Tax=Amycolatopsis iheyensis TaxID=2945988 RepID=A0A9X2NE67_9PSEU|nr:hypothetical protein [Amycolatopsis iheyensis]MCR6485059.1 hypothetical protein [Amycolatopsis iheyensis]
MAGFRGFTFTTGHEVVPGTVPAWALVFREGVHDSELCTIGSDAYVGSVSASLPVGLTGGSYEIVVEGMTAEDYRKISLPAGTPLDASLHLWWKDAPTGVLGGLAKFTGLDNPLSATTPEPPKGSLVAELRVDRLSRRPGSRRMDVVVKGRERVVARLAEHHVEGRCFGAPKPAPGGADPGSKPGDQGKNGLEVAVGKIAEGIVSVRGYELRAAQPTPDVRNYAAVPAGTALEALHELSTQAQAALGLYSQEIAVIRDGILHLGEWTKSGTIPRLDVDRPMDDESGLLALERGADLPRDARLPPGLFGPRPPRRTVAVTALGRPDLKPGDRISPVLPPEDFEVTEPPSIGATLLTTLPNLPVGVADPDADASVCRIIEVRHEISREKGFLTTIRAVVLASEEDDGWDHVTPGTAKEAKRARQAGVPFADSAHGAASTIGNVVADLTGRVFGATRSRPAVVHDHAVSPDTPRHTSEVWHSDAAPDGLPGAAQRTKITADAHAELTQVPYVTPFAWGSYGLVLPRYPGTRVVLANVGGSSADFVDVGALWPQDAGPQARPGDYWLALPVEVDEREHLRDPDRQTPNDGPATHDLVDGDGTRVIETARFVLRVTDQLTQVPGRPVPDDDLGAGTVLIESRAGDGAARIVLKGDGSVSITAKSITFEAEDTINLAAKDVRVQLDGGTMDVS